MFFSAEKYYEEFKCYSRTYNVIIFKNQGHAPQSAALLYFNYCPSREISRRRDEKEKDQTQKREKPNYGQYIPVG